MAIAKNNVKIDGIFIKAGEEEIDLGSFECVKEENGTRTYWGLSSDVSKLPKYVGVGSKALCVDTGDVYCFLKNTKKWYKLNMPMNL